MQTKSSSAGIQTQRVRMSYVTMRGMMTRVVYYVLVSIRYYCIAPISELSSSLGLLFIRIYMLPTITGIRDSFLCRNSASVRRV